jgi:choline dehydrogenase-like flavoprotein
MWAYEAEELLAMMKITQNSDIIHPQSYDLVVIGAGPAGTCGANTAATFGHRVALLHRWRRKPRSAALGLTLARCRARRCAKRRWRYPAGTRANFLAWTFAGIAPVLRNASGRTSLGPIRTHELSERRRSRRNSSWISYGADGIPASR